MTEAKSLLEAWKKLYDYRNSDDKEGLEIMIDEFGALLAELDNQAKTAGDIHAKVQFLISKPLKEYTSKDEAELSEKWIPLSAIHEEAKKETKP
jgi:hypothetical protein